MEKYHRCHRTNGFGVIVRLNNGYMPNGTIPHSTEYQRFAQRCANFVRSSGGAKISSSISRRLRLPSIGG